MTLDQSAAPGQAPGFDRQAGGLDRQAPTLDPNGPLPLYHQIVVALRYRIATGRLSPGTRLPPIRTAADAWSVNYHTVRKAYGILREMGLVEMRRGAGTRVTASTARARDAGAGTLQTFVSWVAREGSERYGLSTGQLADLLRDRRDPRDESPLERAAGVDAGTGRATVVECNRHQCADLAGQLRRAYELEVDEFVLSSPGAPPPGTLIGTWFHLTEMRERWPERRWAMHFPAIEPDPALRERLARWRPTRGAADVPLCERESTLAEAMAGDVETLLRGDGFTVIPVVDRSVEEVIDARPGRPVLVAPRLWDELAPELRRRPGVIEVPYRFRDHDLRALADALGWPPRRSADPAGGGHDTRTTHEESSR